MSNNSPILFVIYRSHFIFFVFDTYVIIKVFTLLFVYILIFFRVVIDCSETSKKFEVIFLKIYI